MTRAESPEAVPAGSGAGPLDNIAPQLTQIVADFVEQQRLPGACVGLVLGERLIWAATVGMADVERERPTDRGTLYEIASVSKTFTATAVLQLRAEGRLRLDDPVVEYVPEAQSIRDRFGSFQQLTIRSLLLHTSGLQDSDPNRDPREWTVLTQRDLLGSLHQAQVVIPPWSAVKYSSLGYSLLAVVVERAAGRDFASYLRRSILDPLGMSSTTMAPEGAQAERCAIGYRPRRGGEAFRRARSIDPRWAPGAAGLWSSLDDLARWVGQQLRSDPELARGPSQVLAGPTIAEMQAPVVIGDSGWTIGRGLGWSTLRRDGWFLVGHDGSDPGFSSSLRFITRRRIGAIVLINGQPRGGARSLALSLIDVAVPQLDRAEPVEAAPPTTTPGAGRWEAVIGTYDDPESTAVWHIAVQGGRLVAAAEPDGDGIALEATDDPLVFIALGGRPVGEVFHFFRGAAETVDGLNAAGMPFVRRVRRGT